MIERRIVGVALGLWLAAAPLAHAQSGVAQSAPARSGAASSRPAGLAAPAGAPGGAGAVIASSNALPAGQGAAVARLRATAGAPGLTETYRTDCGSNVNIGSVVGDNVQNARIDNVYVGQINVIDLGRCKELKGLAADFGKH